MVSLVSGGSRRGAPRAGNRHRSRPGISDFPRRQQTPRTLPESHSLYVFARGADRSAGADRAALGRRGAVCGRIADFDEGVRLALLRRIKLVVTRAQDARPPVIIGERILADMVVNRPGLRSIVRYVIDKHKAEERFVLAEIDLVMQLAGHFADSLEKRDANRLDVARGVAGLGPPECSRRQRRYVRVRHRGERAYRSIRAESIRPRRATLLREARRALGQPADASQVRCARQPWPR